MIGDDPAIRRVFEFDLRRHAYSGRTWTWRMADPSHSVSDVTLLHDNRFLVLERHNGQGAGATWKRAFPVGHDRLAVVNDTNISGSKGRNPARDDDSDFIQVRVPGLSR